MPRLTKDLLQKSDPYNESYYYGQSQGYDYAVMSSAGMYNALINVWELTVNNTVHVHVGGSLIIESFQTVLNVFHINVH